MYSLETSYRTSDLTTRNYPRRDVANIHSALLRLNFTTGVAILFQFIRYNAFIK